jgi:coenzyme F420-0:L-glutamate ligase/coenzyme F420-1:gamma-L-glutamate ligase
VICAADLPGIPEVRAGDDPAELIADALARSGAPGRAGLSGAVLVVAHKLISKAEGRTRRLADVIPSPRALELADRLGGKDPRHVQVVLDETREVRRAEHGVLISETHHGFVCANAGVDASNAAEDETVIMLPLDPDRSARGLRAGLAERIGTAPAVIITDSFGRAWRHGQCDVAIGCAGLQPLEDWRGRTDRRGRELKATLIATADELAAAADLVRTKDGGQPAVLITGLQRVTCDDDGPGIAPMLRGADTDLFR